MATHSSIVAWRNPIDREAWRTIQSMGLQKSRMQLSDSQQQHTSLLVIWHPDSPRAHKGRDGAWTLPRAQPIELLHGHTSPFMEEACSPTFHSRGQQKEVQKWKKVVF